MVSFKALTSDAGLKQLDVHLATRSYISGYQASRDDLAVYGALSAAPANKYPNALRWYNHIHALLGLSFPGAAEGVSIEGQANGAATRGMPAGAAAPAADDDDEDLGKDVMDDDDDDEDLDLFGEMSAEEKAAREEHKKVVEKKKAKAAEKAKLSKSLIIMDVKPWDDETDLAEMEKFVRSVTKDGLLWGSSKLVPIGFGIKKLQITAVIEDAKVESFDIIIEDDLVQDGDNPHIQSVDVVSFNKL